MDRWIMDNPDQDDIYKLVSLENLNSLPYLAAVIDESSRLYPSALFIERKCMADITLRTNDERICINVKKDDIIHVPIWSLHHDKKYFPNPDEFQPERFIGPPTFPKSAFLTFGAGPKACIGKSLALLEIKSIIFHIIRNFKLDTCAETMVLYRFYIL